MGVAADIEAVLTAGRYNRLVPADYVLDRPVLIFADNTEVDCYGSTFTREFSSQAAGHDAFVFAPADFLPTAVNHFSVDATTSKYAFRPIVGGVHAGIAFFATGLNRPRVSGTLDGYEHVTRLRVHLWLRRHAANWSAYTNCVIFGMRGPDPNHPGPFHVGFNSGGLVLTWRDTTGANRNCQLPAPLNNPAECRYTFDVDLATGAWTGHHNDTQVASGGFSRGLVLENDRCQVGYMAAAINDGGYLTTAGAADISFLGATVICNQSLSTVSSQFGSGTTGTTFAWYNDSLATALDHQFSRWWGQSGFGAGLVVKAVDVARIAHAGVRGLKVTSSSAFGSGVAVWAGDHFRGRDIDVSGGACGVASPGQPSNSYPCHLENVRLLQQTTAGLLFNFTDLHLKGVNKILYSKMGFVLGRASNLYVDHLFAATGQEVPANARWLVRVDECAQVRLQNISINIEAHGGWLRDAYYRFSPTSDAGAGDVLVILDGCSVQGIGGGVPALKLTGRAAGNNTATYQLRTPIPFATRTAYAFAVMRPSLITEHLVIEGAWSAW